MREKKVILLVMDDEQELSVLKFMLSTNSFRVLSATNLPEAVDQFASYPVNLVIADFLTPKFDGVHLANELKRRDMRVPMVLFGSPTTPSEMPPGVDRILSARAVSPADLLELVKCMTARKRGPWKGHRRAAREVSGAVC